MVFAARFMLSFMAASGSRWRGSAFPPSLQQRRKTEFTAAVDVALKMSADRWVAYMVASLDLWGSGMSGAFG